MSNINLFKNNVIANYFLITELLICQKTGKYILKWNNIVNEHSQIVDIINKIIKKIINLN